MTAYVNQAKLVPIDEVGSQMIAYGDEFEPSSDFGKSLSSMNPLSVSGEVVSLLMGEIQQWPGGYMSGWPVNKNNLSTRPLPVGL
jgi:hypothetical protein